MPTRGRAQAEFIGPTPPARGSSCSWAMMPIDGQSGTFYQPTWPTGVAAASPCPIPGLNQHRLVERPVLNSLLGHLPGSVPYSTHVEIEAARNRLVHQELGKALEQLGAEHMNFAELAAKHPLPEHRPLPFPAAPPVQNADRIEQGVAYTLPRRKWPIGGLVDLVI